MSGPITPQEALREAVARIPDDVFEVFNSLIRQKAGAGRIVIDQDDVLARLVIRGYDRRKVFDENWLDVEEAYEVAGWKVTYDKPAYSEIGSPKFVFERKR